MIGVDANSSTKEGPMRYLAIDILVVFMMFLVAYGIYLRFHLG